MLIKTVLLLASSLVLLLAYLYWAQDKRSGPLLSDLRLRPIASEGTPAQAGNLLAIEARLQPADYQSRERLRLKFSTYLEQAREAGLLSSSSIVALPEHVGTGLFAIGEKAEVQQARTLRDAMQWMALSNPWDYLREQFDNSSDDRRTEAVLRSRAKDMAKAYQAIFSGLARDYGITLVAGSIVLPEPYIEQDRLRIGDGPLRQISLVFDPEGKLLPPLHHKQRLSRYERRYSEAIAQAPRQTSATPAGRLSVTFGCENAAPEAELVVALGGPEDGCRRSRDIPLLSVRTLGLPWNLVGSPRRAEPVGQRIPVRLHNLWLPGS
ncbi:carbon-nitrogen hydrolase [Stutzerimonas kirkiae]|uniref:Carbon-nitrogen hydrolase n=1 Tax=Stutzerimonas kirkiae TaxID=2211392 RepID=A0A4Q9RGC5_9GAMM|nr:carbon-nitrogen hydrolase [Stutzerimonas kirkiae]TBV05818.1 carbon-nitrogen hydrolase [Stutzerimonas kirkiae]TBV10665.1 carbon-nitrogen hydrolase [Stutzerimonas kirkiae]